MLSITTPLTATPSGHCPIVHVRMAAATDPARSPARLGEYKPALALVDPNATTCVVSEKIRFDLGLIQIGEQPAPGDPWKSSAMAFYGLAIAIPEIGFEAIVPTLVAANSPHWDAVIGKAVLDHVQFTYDGPAKRLVLAKP